MSQRIPFNFGASNPIGYDFGGPRAPAGPTTARTPQNDPLADPAPGFLGGFVSSAASGIGELFGAQPFESATAFRNENPVSGFVSQLVGTAVPYAGWARATMLPRLARPLEAATQSVASRLGLNALEAPVRTGIIRETMRYLPLDVTSAAMRDYADDGVIGTRMFADVGLSMLITGGVGAIGGYIRSGGRRGPQPSHVNAEEGSSLLLTPTHQLDSLMRGAEVVGPASRDDLRVALRNEILTEQTARGSSSGVPLPYLTRLEGMTGAEDVAAVNSLFEVRGRGNRTTMRQLVAEGPADDRLTLNVGEQAVVVQQLGFENADELARNTIFPRLINVRNPAGAERLNSILDRPTLRNVGEGTFIGREPEGAFVVAKRLEPGNGTRTGVVAEGDRWFVARTTNPHAFVPEAARIGETTMATWAKWKQQFQPSYRHNVFDQSHDTMLAAMTPLDYADMRRMSRGNWVRQMSGKLAANATDLAAPGMRSSIRDSKTLRDSAEWLYDTFKPTMFLEHQDSRFGRFFGLMRNSVRTADQYSTRIMQGAARIEGSPSQALRGKKINYVSGFNGFRPVREIVDDLTPDEVNLIAHASAGSELPETALRELAESGQLSTKAVAAVTELQAINRAMLDDLVLPAIKDLPHTADVKWLEGYIMPRIYRGDFRVNVKNEKGETVFLAAGRNGSQAQAEARAVVEEATQKGRQWTYDEAQIRHILDNPDAPDLNALQEQLVRRLANSQDDAAVVYSAMRRLASMKATSGRNPSIPATTSTLKTRTGRAGSPDVHTYTHEDFLEAIDGHTRTLLRFAGMQAWRERFYKLAWQWGQDNPKLFENLMRKSQQYMGIEGQITNTLNRTLEPVLGSVLGKKAATKIAAATNEVMYNWNLAFVNPTFALLNLLTPLQTVAPWIALMTRAPTHEAAKMMQFVPLFDNAGNIRGNGSVLEPMKVLAQATRQLRNPDEELKVMMERGIDDGVFSAQLYEEWVGRSARASQTLKESFQQGGMLEFIRRGGTYMAEKSESYSRMISFNSGYLVGKHHFGLQGDGLYRFARRTTEVTMFQYGTVDRSRIFTGPVGSMFGLFKNWQFHFIGNMLGYAGLAMRHNVWSPLLWSMGAATALGGLGATPLKHIADGLANWHGNENGGYHWLRENYGEAGDAIYFGLPSFLGISLQASSTLPGTDVRNEINSLGSFVIFQRMKALGAALGDGWQAQMNGESAMRDPNIRDKLLAALAPRAIFRASSAVEGDYVRSMSTGYPIVQNVSPAGRILHGLGMNVVEIERWQLTAKELYRDQEARKSTLDALGAAFADASLNGDFERANQIALRGIAQGIELDSLVRSAQTRMRREQGDLLSRYSKEDQAEFRAIIDPGSAAPTWQPGMPR